MSDPRLELQDLMAQMGQEDFFSLMAGFMETEGLEARLVMHLTKESGNASQVEIERIIALAKCDTSKIDAALRASLCKLAEYAIADGKPVSRWLAREIVRAFNTEGLERHLAKLVGCLEGELGLGKKNPALRTETIDAIVEKGADQAQRIAGRLRSVEYQTAKAEKMSLLLTQRKQDITVNVCCDGDVVAEQTFSLRQLGPEGAAVAAIQEFFLKNI